MLHSVKRLLRHEMWKELVASVDTRGAVRDSKPAALLFRICFLLKNSNWLSGVRRSNRVLENFAQQANSYVRRRSSSSFHFHACSVQVSNTGATVGLRSRLSWSPGVAFSPPRFPTRTLSTFPSLPELRPRASLPVESVFDLGWRGTARERAVPGVSSEKPLLCRQCDVLFGSTGDLSCHQSSSEQCRCEQRATSRRDTRHPEREAKPRSRTAKQQQ